MPSPSPDVREEPAFLPPPPASVPCESDVWEEPALMPGLRPADPEITHAAWLRRRWRDARPGPAWLLSIGLLAVSAPVAVLCALLKSGSFVPLAAAAIVAPLVEELGKAMGPLMAIEKSPYRFTSGAQPLLVCALGGLAFALVENAIYFNVYLDAPSPDLVAWRGSVCVALHVGCSSIAGLGLRRAWLAARAAETRADLRLASPHLVLAMVLHGAYNAAAIFLERARVFDF